MGDEHGMQHIGLWVGVRVCMCGRVCGEWVCVHSMCMCVSLQGFMFTASVGVCMSWLSFIPHSGMYNIMY